ncbi:MAG: oxygen-insensitive NADPH nitroreductase [Actinomycetia bacterium]|nr:oxygen-insensitive NADPH nitroreductase [Actinomycetes bacterium]
MHDIHQLLRSHRSIRKFVAEELDDQVVNDLVRSGLSAATSSNLQATTVIRVRSQDVKEQIAEVAGGQQQIVSAGAFLVWCADLNRTRRACEAAGGSMTSGMTEQFIIATVDVALAAQNAVVAAEAQGLGICYIGAVRNDPQRVSDLLELPDDVYPVFGLCIGEPAQDPEVKPRLPLDVVLKDDIYSIEGEAEAIREYDEVVSEYYRTRSGGRKDSSWTQEMAGLVDGEKRPHMRPFLANRGFELR